MKLYVHDKSPILNQLGSVITRSVQYHMDFLSVIGVTFMYLNEKKSNVVVINRFVIVNNGAANIAQIQRPQYIQTGSASRCFH